MMKVIKARIRFYWRLIQKLLAPQKFRAFTHTGASFYLYNPKFNLETAIYWKGLKHFKWERKTREIWCELCADAKVVFDVGANTGIFSMMAKAINEQAEVHAFEPQPNVFEVLKRNSDTNAFQVHCHQIAVSDKSGVVPFYNYGNDPFGSSNSTAGSLNINWRPINQKSIEVESTTLDEFIVREGISNIDLMKIDVETFEPEVLKGYREQIHVHRPIILLEIQSEDLGRQIERIFKGHVYRYFEIDEETGMKQVEALGRSESLNYLICPEEKLDFLPKQYDCS